MAVDYTIDLIPVAMLSAPLEPDDPNSVLIISKKRRADCGLVSIGCTFPEGSALGIGASPLGFTALFRRTNALQFRLGGTGGAMFFDRPVPTTWSTRFNFTASLEAGAQLLDKYGQGVLLVYRFHHISNAGLGFDNSALASHVISIGARWTRY